MLTVFQHRGEVDYPAGAARTRDIVLQDLSTVPMILLVPILAGMGSAGVVPSLINFGIGLALLGVVTASALLDRPPPPLPGCKPPEPGTLHDHYHHPLPRTAWLTFRAGLVPCPSGPSSPA